MTTNSCAGSTSVSPEENVTDTDEDDDATGQEMPPNLGGTGDATVTAKPAVPAAAVQGAYDEVEGTEAPGDLIEPKFEASTPQPALPDPKIEDSTSVTRHVANYEDSPLNVAQHGVAQSVFMT